MNQNVDIEINDWLTSMGFSDDELEYAINELYGLIMEDYTDWYSKRYESFVYDAYRALGSFSTPIEELIDRVVERLKETLNKSHQSGDIFEVAEFIAILYKKGEIFEFSDLWDTYKLTPDQATSAELLLLAVDDADEESIAFLLSKGVKTELPNLSEDLFHLTPIHLALQRCDIQIVQMLMDNGVDLPNFLFYDDKTDGFEREGAFDGEVEFADWGNDRLFSAYLFFLQREDCLSLYAPYKQRDSFGNNILHYLAIDGVKEIPSVLRYPKNGNGISNDDFLVTNKDGDTPIHIALSVNNWDMILDIVSYEPDLSGPEFSDLAEKVLKADTPYEVVRALESIGLTH